MNTEREKAAAAGMKLFSLQAINKKLWQAVKYRGTEPVKMKISVAEKEGALQRSMLSLFFSRISIMNTFERKWK